MPQSDSTGPCAKFAKHLSEPSRALAAALSPLFADRLESDFDCELDVLAYRDLQRAVFNTLYVESLASPLWLQAPAAQLVSPGWGHSGPRPAVAELWRIRSPQAPDAQAGSPYIDWLDLKVRPAIVATSSEFGYVCVPLTSSVDPRRRRPGRSVFNAQEMGLAGHMYYREHPLLMGPPYALEKLADVPPRAMEGARRVLSEKTFPDRRVYRQMLPPTDVAHFFEIYGQANIERFRRLPIGKLLADRHVDCSAYLARVDWIRDEVARGMSDPREPESVHLSLEAVGRFREVLAKAPYSSQQRPSAATGTGASTKPSTRPRGRPYINWNEGRGIRRWG